MVAMKNKNIDLHRGLTSPLRGFRHAEDAVVEDPIVVVKSFR